MFHLEAIISIVVAATLIILVTVVVNRKWTFIKFHFYAHFANDDDFQDLSEMKFDAFVSYRFINTHYLFSEFY